MMTIESLLEEIRALPVRERKPLISPIVGTLTQDDTSTPSPQRSILEFEGVGAAMWCGIDTQAYINRLRDEWDETP